VSMGWLIHTRSGSRGGRGGLADEPLRVGRVGAIKDGSPGAGDLLGATIVDIGRGQQPDPAVTVLVVVPGEEGLAERRASWMQPNRSGTLGWCLRAL
jgi:hypothetical protein